MLKISTMYGLVKTKGSGSYAEIASDCTVVAHAAVRQYAQIMQMSEASAAIEVMQMILQHIKEEGDNT